MITTSQAAHNWQDFINIKTTFKQFMNEKLSFNNL